MVKLSDGFVASRAELQYDSEKISPEVVALAQTLQDWEFARVSDFLQTRSDAFTMENTTVATFQGHRHHEFSVEEHLKHASYAVGAFTANLLESPYVIVDYESYLLPALTAKVQNKVDAVFDRPADEFSQILATAQVGAYLHDIEKLILPKRVGEAGDAKIAVLTTEDLEVLGLSDYEDLFKLKKAFVVWLTAKTPTDEPLKEDVSIGKLRGIIPESIDIERLRRMLDVYFVIDKRFIADGSRIADDPNAYQENLDIAVSEIKALNPENIDIVFGAMIMLADNVAQGVPPEAPERFERDLARYACFCNDVIDRLI